jgi:hypothetical protein
MALVGTTSLPMLLDLFEAGKLDVARMVTHGMTASCLYIMKQSANKEIPQTSNLQTLKGHTKFLARRQRQKH